MVSTTMGARVKYDINEHVHRFAVWTAARAVQRGFLSTTGTSAAIEAAGICEFVEEHAATLNMLPDEFDRHHRIMVRRIIEHWAARQVANGSYGRAAKVIAVYLKTAVVIPAPESTLARIAHPPIDGILLRRLQKKTPVNWREVLGPGAPRWTQFDEVAYFAVVAELRRIAKEAPLWSIEKHWDPSAASELARA